MTHTVYDISTGRILGSVFGVFSIQVPIDGEGLIENGGVVDGGTHYYDLINSIKVRPEMSISVTSLTISSDGIDSTTISNLPNPCTVYVDEQKYTVTDGLFEFSTDFAGIYSVKIKSFPYTSVEFEVTAI